LRFEQHQILKLHNYERDFLTAFGSEINGIMKMEGNYCDNLKITVGSLSCDGGRERKQLNSQEIHSLVRILQGIQFFKTWIILPNLAI
jgi:hypothetical protein